MDNVVDLKLSSFASTILLLWKQDDLYHLDSRWWFCNLNTESTEVIPCEVWTTELLYGQRRDSAGATVKGLEMVAETPTARMIDDPNVWLHIPFQHSDLFLWSEQM